MRIGNKEFDTKNHTYVMGILNVTPDSFSDGGKWKAEDAAMLHVKEMIDDGVDILDIGGESTRPGHVQISVQEEIDRVVPIIEKIKKNYDIPISVDTYKSEVAEAALQAGTDLVNDIWGCLYDEKMAEVIRKYDAACCLMHNRKESVYLDFLNDMCQDLEKCIQTVKTAGVGAVLDQVGIFNVHDFCFFHAVYLKGTGGLRNEGQGFAKHTSRLQMFQNGLAPVLMGAQDLDTSLHNNSNLCIVFTIRAYIFARKVAFFHCLKTNHHAGNLVWLNSLK